MRSSSQGAPEWLYKKKLEPEANMQLDQTLTKPFYASKSINRASDRFTAQKGYLNPDADFSKELTANLQKEKDNLSQMLKLNHFTSHKPIEHNCRSMLQEFKKGQFQQDMELLNREHERLRRLLTQR